MRRWLAEGGLTNPVANESGGNPFAINLWDVLKPWQHRSWIFLRHPHFALKTARVLDLYERVWGGEPLGDDEYVLSAEEKPGCRPAAASSRRCNRPRASDAGGKRVDEVMRTEPYTSARLAQEFHDRPQDRSRRRCNSVLGDALRRRKATQWARKP